MLKISNQKTRPETDRNLVVLNSRAEGSWNEAAETADSLSDDLEIFKGGRHQMLNDEFSSIAMSNVQLSTLKMFSCDRSKPALKSPLA